MMSKQPEWLITALSKEDANQRIRDKAAELAEKRKTRLKTGRGKPKKRRKN